jgi:FkbM family methyltransferase
LWPQPDEGGICPRCERPLQHPTLRLSGWRFLLDGRCRGCEHRYLQDLPYGHGLIYPATLDLDTGETFQVGDGAWFAAALRPLWERPDTANTELEVQARAAASRVVLINCLDKVYGHMLLKLLNAGRQPADPDLSLVVLVPESLAHLVPAGVAESWILHAPTSRCSGWLMDLEPRLRKEIQRFDECLLSPAFPHPHPSTYNLDDFTGAVTPERSGEPSIVFSLRSDRRWGRDGRQQRANVARLRERILGEFPEAGFVALGAGEHGGLPESMEDRSATAPDADRERDWLALLRGADLVIGVHGSNLLLPSALARATVELLPRARYGNAFQATLLSTADPTTALIRHRVVYGDDDLSDVDPDRLAEIALSILSSRERTERMFSGPLAGQGGAQPALPAGGAEISTPQPAGAATWRDIRPSRALRRWAASLATSRRAAALRRRAHEAELPAVISDERGLRFEMRTAEELERFALDGHVESDELRVLAAYASDGMMAIDVGANFGVVTATLAASVNPGGAVHSFEPLAAARARLERTIELNALGNVTVNQTAVTDRTGEVQLFDYGPGYESWATLVPREIETGTQTLRAAPPESIPSVTLDDYCQQGSIGRVDILKIDVEGAEERVLRGAARLLEDGRVDLVMVEVADTTLMPAGTRAHALLDLLERRGLWTYRLEGGRLRPFRVAGEQTTLANVFAASDTARLRLEGLGVLSRA